MKMKQHPIKIHCNKYIIQNIKNTSILKSIIYNVFVNENEITSLPPGL